jgi:hypothetical protein
MRRLFWIALIIAAFGVGYAAGWLSPHHSLRDLERVQGAEKQRVTDPSGQFDAVLLLESWGGPIGEINWYICIVEKGRSAASVQEASIVASDVRGAKLVWRQPHLLEFQYERAMILEFTNLWGSNEIKPKAAFSGGDPYWVEIRLAPTSPGFSLVTPDNDFR